MEIEKLKFVMTTTFYPPYHIGGDAMHVYHLSNELARHGHEVHIIHSIDSYYWQRKKNPVHEYPNHENVIVHSIKSPIGKISPLVSYIFGLPYPVDKEIRSIINEVKPDVLHHHNIAGLGPFVLGIKAPKVLYTAHDYWLICPMNDLTRPNGTYCANRLNCFTCSIKSHRPPQVWRYTEVLNKYNKNIDVIITPSDFMKNKLNHFGLTGNIRTIHNFALKPIESGEPFYAYPYFLFVGVLEEHKGILNLVDAVIDLKSENNAKLLIAGTGSLENTIKEKISKTKCKDRIILLGRVDDYTLANLYANAVAVVLPSIWPENCPLVALEALANGTPIIVSNKGGLPEIALKSKAVTVVEYDLASTIHNFLANLNVVRDMACYSDDYFTISRFLREYEEVCSK